MAGIEVHIPYVNFKTKVQGFPRRVNAPATELTIQEHLQYYSNKVMLKTSLEPLNTTDNQVDWEILDGNNYCSIDGSTGELTIDSSTITQMVKVRAKSRANANLYEDKEIVLTHRDVEGIEQMQLQILFEDLESSYTYANDSTVYSFYVKVQPNVDITMGYDILEGTEDIEITNIQPITSGTHKDQVLIQFKLLGTHTNSDVKIRFYDADYPADLYADAEFTAYAPISSISVSGLSEYSDQDQTAHYFWGNEYSFSYSTSPSVKRNLVVECTQNNDKISVWNLPNGNLSSGTIGFTSLTTDSNTVYKVKISDPDDENVYKEVTFLINTPVISDIVVTGNTGRYAYNSDENVYNTIGFYADPSIHRPLRLNFVEGDDLISWDVSNRLEDSGDLVFRVLDPSREGITRFLLQDSLYADSSKYVQFGVYTPITSILFNDVQDRYVHDASNTAYSFGYYALPNVPRHLDVSVLSGANNISWNLTNVVDSSGQFNFNLLGAVAEGNVSLRVSDPYDDSVYADTSFVFYSPISSIDVTGLQDHYICNEDNTTWYEIEVNTTPHVVRNLNISFSGVNWVKENENGSYTKIKFQCIDGSQGQKTLTISDPYWTVNQYTANTMFYEIFKMSSFHYKESQVSFINNIPAGYTVPTYITDSYGNQYYDIHYQTPSKYFSIRPYPYHWIIKRASDDIKSRIHVSVPDNNREINLRNIENISLPYTSGPEFAVNVVGKTLDSSAILRISDTLSDTHFDFNIITKAPMYSLTFVDNSSLYKIDREDTSKIFAIKYTPGSPVGREPLVTLTGDTSYITYDTSAETTTYVQSDIYNNHYLKFSVKDEYKYKDSYLHLKVEDSDDSNVYANTDFILYSPITRINFENTSPERDNYLFFYGTGDSRNTKQIALTREPIEIERALDISVGLYDVSTQNGQPVMVDNFNYHMHIDGVYDSMDSYVYNDFPSKVIPHTIVHYDSSPHTDFITFELDGDCDGKLLKITATDPFDSSINSTVSYETYVDVEIAIYDKSDGTQQNLANVYDYYQQPTSLEATLMPINKIPMEVVLYPVTGGTISPFRTTTVNNSRGNYWKTGGGRIIEYSDRRGYINVNTYWKKVAEFLRENSNMKESEIQRIETYTTISSFIFTGNYANFTYQPEQDYDFDVSKLNDSIGVNTATSYYFPANENLSIAQNLYLQAVIHDFEKEIVFVEHGTDNIITDPNTIVEISNNRMDSGVIDVDVIYRTIPYYYEGGPIMDTYENPIIGAYPEIINYGNYGNWKPESIQPLHILAVSNGQTGNAHGASESISIRYNQKYMSSYKHKYTTDSYYMSPINTLRYYATVNGIKQGLNVSSGCYYATKYKDVSGDFITQGYDYVEEYYDNKFDVSVYSYYYPFNPEADKITLTQSVIFDCYTDLQEDTSILHDVYTYDYDISINGSTYYVVNHHDELEVMKNDTGKGYIKPVLSLIYDSSNILDKHKLHMYLHFKEWYGRPQVVTLSSYNGKYTFTSTERDKIVDTSGNILVGKEIVAYANNYGGTKTKHYDSSINDYYSNYTGSNNGSYWKTHNEWKNGNYVPPGYFYPDTSSNTSPVPDINTLKNFEFEIRFFDNSAIENYYNATTAYVTSFDSSTAENRRFTKMYIDNTWSADKDWHYNPAYNPLNYYPYRAWRIKFTDGDN